MIQFNKYKTIGQSYIQILLHTKVDAFYVMATLQHKVTNFNQEDNITACKRTK